MSGFISFTSLRASRPQQPAGIWRWSAGLVLAASALAAASTVAAAPRIPPAERQALLSLYAATDGDRWTERSGWGGAAGGECAWYGVRCDARGRHVVGIHLPNNGLTGRLPKLGAFTRLTTLVLPLNYLSGPLPLADLPRLRVLKVNNNLLDGALPALGQWRELEQVDLANNQFEGELPSLGTLMRLRTLDVSNNQLTGVVPGLRGLPELRRFDASFNRMNE